MQSGEVLWFFAFRYLASLNAGLKGTGESNVLEVGCRLLEFVKLFFVVNDLDRYRKCVGFGINNS